MQLNTHESISIYACRVEDLVNKDWPNAMLKCVTENLLNLFIQGHHFKLKRLSNEKKLDHSPTQEEPVISFEIPKNYINRKHIANEMTPKPSNEVNYIESTHR